MTEQPNRIGAALGAHGHGLDAIYHRLGLLIDAVEANTAAIIAQGGNQAAIVAALGDPATTDCGVPMLDLLCFLAQQFGFVGTVPPPGGPAFRCGGLYVGGYWTADSWLPSSAGRLDAPNAFYANWTTEFDSPEATIVVETLEGDTAPLPTLHPGIVPRTVCISAYVGEGVEFFSVDRYDAVTLEYHDTAFIGTIDFADVWQEGVTYNVDPAYIYRFYVVMPEGVTVVPSGTFLYYTEGALG